MIGQLCRRAVYSGSVGAAVSTFALAAVALIEDKDAAQPLNATSHWLNGDRAARRRQTDLRHTGVGLGTHTAATVFWALCYETWLIDRPPNDASDVIVRAASVAALAAAVDYTITPKRFTPGWELVLSKGAMAVVYAAMAAGFAVATLARSRP